MGLTAWLRGHSRSKLGSRADSSRSPPRRSRYRPQPPPPLGPRRDSVVGNVVSHYRADLVKIHHRLEDALIAFDREPDEYSLTLVIRRLRTRLDTALDTYYSALGSRSTDRITAVLDCAKRVDVRLASLDEEICAEVSRFQSAADEIAMYVRPGAPSGARNLYAADANELLLELVVYRTSWDAAIQGREGERLDEIESVLRSILDAGPSTPASAPLPIIRAVKDDHVTSSSSASPSASSSSDGTFAAAIRKSSRARPPPGPRRGAEAHERGRGSDDRRQRRRRRPADQRLDEVKSHDSSSQGTSPPLPPHRFPSNHYSRSRNSHSANSPSPSADSRSGSSRSRESQPTKIGAREEYKRVGRNGYGSRIRDNASDYVIQSAHSQDSRGDRAEPYGHGEHRRRSHGKSDAYDFRGEHKAYYPGANSSAESAERSQRSSARNENWSQRQVLSRSRTLRDMAAAAQSEYSNEGRGAHHEAAATAAAESMFSDYAKHAANEVPSSSGTGRSSTGGTSRNSRLSGRSQPPIAPGKSFASILYTTQNARSEGMSDRGLGFRPIEVRGDGRCLFRSVARARDVSRGNWDMSERAERETADDLRARTVRELKKHKALLTQFYVIETDFARYCKRMSNPRTFGGEPELLVLAKILHCPIAVYILVNGQYKQIQVYGRQYRAEPCRILYSDGVHYDALVTIK